MAVLLTFHEILNRILLPVGPGIKKGGIVPANVTGRCGTYFITGPVGT